MSLNAPWLALSCDWHDSEMFDGTTPAQKLAWVALLCFSKSKGRAGKLTIHPAAVCRDFGIERADLDEMLRRAVDAGAIEIDQNDVTTVRFTSWALYQDPSQRRTSLVKDGGFSKKSATKDQGPRTKDQSPVSIAPKTIEAIYQAYPRKVAKAEALKAIGKAAARVKGRPETQGDPAAWLLGRVVAFAESPAGKAGTFTPHPATWFNKGRYDDDQAEWQRTEDNSRDGPAETPEQKAERAKADARRINQLYLQDQEDERKHGRA